MRQCIKLAERPKKGRGGSVADNACFLLLFLRYLVILKRNVSAYYVFSKPAGHFRSYHRTRREDEESGSQTDSMGLEVPYFLYGKRSTKNVHRPMAFFSGTMHFLALGLAFSGRMGGKAMEFSSGKKMAE